MRFYLRFIVYTAAIAAWPVGTAHAQRGNDDMPRQPGNTSRFDGFPGFFDAGMLEKGHWQLEYLPVPGVRYGIAEEASLKVSALPVAAFLSNRGWGAGFELRHRIWALGDVSVVGTLGATYLALGDIRTTDSDTMEEIQTYNNRLSSMFAVVTAEWRASDRATLAGTAMTGYLKMASASPVGDSNTRMDSSAELNGAGFMVTGSYFIGGLFGIQGGLGYTPSLEVEFRGGGGAQRVDLKRILDALNVYGFIPRVALYLRTRRLLAGISLTGILPSVEIAQTW